jgi:hypothetical protein
VRYLDFSQAGPARITVNIQRDSYGLEQNMKAGLLKSKTVLAAEAE